MREKKKKGETIEAPFFSLVFPSAALNVRRLFISQHEYIWGDSMIALFLFLSHSVSAFSIPIFVSAVVRGTVPFFFLFVSLFY